MTENEAVFEFCVGNDVTDERYALAMERVSGISDEHLENKEIDNYFHAVKDFILMLFLAGIQILGKRNVFVV